jgi:hypothetical protein
MKIKLTDDRDDAMLIQTLITINAVSRYKYKLLRTILYDRDNWSYNEQKIRERP